MYQRRGHFTYLRFFFKSQRVCIVWFSSHSCTFLRTSDAFPPILYIITWHMWQRDRYFWYSLCIVTTHFDKLCILQYLSQLQFLKCVSTLSYFWVEDPYINLRARWSRPSLLCSEGGLGTKADCNGWWNTVI